MRGSNRVLEASEEYLVEWDNRVQSLFEWIGLACLGAQRFDFARVQGLVIENIETCLDYMRTTVWIPMSQFTNTPHLQASMTLHTFNGGAFFTPHS